MKTTWPQCWRSRCQTHPYHSSLMVELPNEQEYGSRRTEKKNSHEPIMEGAPEKGAAEMGAAEKVEPNAPPPPKGALALETDEEFESVGANIEL